MNIEELYLEQIEDYCNVTFSRDNLPSGVALAIAELVKIDPSSYRVSSESLSDMSVSYSNDGGKMPEYIKGWLAPYRRPHLVGNKKKRPYKDGR